MVQRSEKVNNASKGAAKKALVAALAVICALILLIAGFFFVKDTLYFSLAQSRALDNNFESAKEWADKSAKEEAEILLDYILLREDINQKYPELLAAFDGAVIADWSQRASEIAALAKEAPDIDPAITEKTENISSVLEYIVTVTAGYEAIKPDIYELMNLFAEYGRLYTKDADGLNIVFTVNEETLKLDNWELLNNKITEFARSFDEGGKVYLLNYMIQEARGEISLLRTAFEESGFDIFKTVRLEGENTRKVSTVQNGNETISLIEKEKYESYMHSEICKALIENLGEFFIY